MKEPTPVEGTEAESRYSALIARLERDAVAAPARYKWRILLLSMLGYAYPIVVLTGLLATMSSAVYVMAWAPPALIGVGLSFGAKLFVIPLLALSYAIVRSLWVRLPPPEGRRIGRAEAPRLFDLCELLRKRLRGPHIHRILVTDDFNASIVQISRLGLFGWPRNYLIIGLPLMLAMSPSKFEAVLAHEYGHLAGAHGHFSAWVYRIRQTWERLATTLGERTRWGAFLFAPFFNWYAPYFNAYSFVLARANEYEADRCSADIVGAHIAADALIDHSVKEQALGFHFWSDLWKRAGHQLEPPYLPYGQMGAFFKAPLDAEFKRRSLRSALAETTDNEDTHPSLVERIKALGQEPQLPLDLELSAAESLLDLSLDNLIGEFDREWRQESAHNWRERFYQVLDWRRELAGLEAKGEHGPLDAEERWQQATLTEEVEGMTAALPVYRSLLQSDPEHVGANFAVGRIMLENGDGDGLEPLEAAMKLDPYSIGSACEHAYRHLIQADRKDEAKSYQERARRRYELEQSIEVERGMLSPADTLLPHGLDSAALELLVAQLRGVPALQRVYLMRKKLELEPEHPLYVLAFEIRLELASGTDADEIVEALALNLEFPSVILIYPLIALSHQSQVVIKRYDDALVYEHAESDSASAGEGPWRRHVTAGMEASQRGDQEEAEEQFEIALRKAEFFDPRDERLAQSFNNLAGLYSEQHRYTEAAPLLKRAAAILEETEHPEVATVLSNLAGLYRSQGRYSESRSFLERALEIREKRLGPDHPDVAVSLDRLASVYHDMGKYAGAEPLLKGALAINEGRLGPKHPDVADSLNGLANLYGTQGKWAEAEPLHERALEIWEEVFGPKHPDLAAGLDRLARTYRIAGKYEKAEPIYRRALAVMKETLGPEHPISAASLYGLGVIHRELGKYEEAESYHKKALAILESAAGPDHPYAAFMLSDLALLYTSQGRHTEAESLFQRTLAIRESALGPKHPDLATSLDGYAILLRETGRLDEAENVAARAKAIRVAHSGESVMGPGQ